MSAGVISYKNTAYHSKASDSSKLDTESRDLKSQCDQLRKELERKDSRNEKMTKELQAVRSAHADLQVPTSYCFQLSFFQLLL